MQMLTRAALGAIAIYAVLAGAALPATLNEVPATSHDLLGTGVGLLAYDPVSYVPTPRATS